MSSEFKTLITSKHHLFDLHLRETLSYRDLIFLFVKRDFISKYKQTILGPAWALIQPLLSTTVFTIVFGNLAGLTTADTKDDVIIPGFLFYMIGNICWSYFSSVFSATSNTFISNSGTMGKVYYPRLVAPLATALSILISFAIQFAMLMAFWFYYYCRGNTSIHLSPMMLMIPLCLLQTMLLAVGGGIIISSLTTKYRDLCHLVTFGLELWRYACPLAYGLSLVPDKYKFYYMLNPMAPVVTTFRYAILGFGFFDLTLYLLSWLVCVILFLVGLVLFSRIERTFMDTI